MTKKLQLCFALLLGVGLTASHAQQAVTSSGNSASGSGGSVSWSVGQVAYTTNIGKAGTISQGVQQVYKVSIVAKQAFHISLAVFPNPVTDNLIVQSPNFKTERLSYQFFDMHGKLLKSGLLTGARTEINTSALPATVYLLQIRKGDQQVQTFKIIKN
jgi:Secretion system C-terminal sorting domain